LAGLFVLRYKLSRQFTQDERCLQMG